MKKHTPVLLIALAFALSALPGLRAEGQGPGEGNGRGPVFADLPFAGDDDSVADAAMHMMPIARTGTAPTITTQPASASVATGASVSFTVVATGTPAPTYQWSKNGRFIRGATAATLTIPASSPADAGAYTVQVFNGAGYAKSAAATLSVAPAGLVTSAPKNLSIATGATAAFSVTATGTGLTYQWQYSGISIPGATSANYSLANAGPGASGIFTVLISNSTGVVAAEAATLQVTTNARLSNLSVRGLVGTGDQALVVGFVSQGSATKQILLRGVGPTLGTQFSVTGSLATPVLTLYGWQGKAIDTNSGWGGTTALSQAFAKVGAFPLPTASADTALLESLAAGVYSAHITGLKNTTGVALAEIYDADPGTPASTLVNLSARAFVADGSNVLIAGFVVTGPSSETILIRGVGPSLGSLFRMSNALKATQVTLFDVKGNPITANAGWGDNPLITANGTAVGAFPFEAHSKDSALLVTLPPGAYSAHVTGVSGTTGLGMIEIYEVR